MNNIEVRQLGIMDYIPAHDMYESMSEKSRWLFHPDHILTGRPHEIQWFLFQLLLIISLTPIRQILLTIVPRAAIVMMGAYFHGKMVGLAFMSGISSLPDGTRVSGMGIGVVDSYQNMGIGTLLMLKIIATARTENISRIRLTVQNINSRAIRMYVKYGFQVISDYNERYKGVIIEGKLMEVQLK